MTLRNTYMTNTMSGYRGYIDMNLHNSKPDLNKKPIGVVGITNTLALLIMGVEGMNEDRDYEYVVYRFSNEEIEHRAKLYYTKKDNKPFFRIRGVRYHLSDIPRV